MSEFELGLFRQRARLAFEQKVRKGYALWELPVGFIRTEEYQVEKVPDRQVQQAIEGVFSKFRELGSARQAFLWYREEQILLPQAQPGTAGREIVWRLPTPHRILQILKNPCYAGALAYGRTGSKTVVHEGRARKSYHQRRPLEQWQVLIVDHHSRYITWHQYLENQKVLEANLATRGGEKTGAAKEGPALLGWAVAVRALRADAARPLQRQGWTGPALCLRGWESESWLGGMSFCREPALGPGGS